MSRQALADESSRGIGGYFEGPAGLSPEQPRRLVCPYCREDIGELTQPGRINHIQFCRAEKWRKSVEDFKQADQVAKEQGPQ